MTDDRLAPDAMETRLRDPGLRVTAPRMAALEVLTDMGGHLRVDEVIERVRATGVAVSVQAGYDVCDALNRAGLLRRLDLPGGPFRYEARVGDNHHHLVCRSCGVVLDIECATGSAPCLHPSDRRGFAVEEAEITFWGVCPECLASPVVKGSESSRND